MDWFIEKLQGSIPFGYARFNDGEMMGIDKVNTTVARGDQFVDQNLSNALKEAILHKQKNYYIGIPCSICYPHYSALAKELIGDYEFITSAVATTNRNWKKFIDTFPAAVKERRIIWIGGADQNTDALKDMGLNIVNTVKVPNQNSWAYYEQIKEKVPNLFQEGDLVGISLGPTARVLVREWFEEYPNTTFVDFGSNFDPYTRNVRHNCHKGWEETGFNLTKPCSECN